jgi:hypothetical protein
MISPGHSAGLDALIFGSARREYNEVQRLVLVFVDIAFHRKGPDALPSSKFLFHLVLLAYASVGALTLALERPLAQVFGAITFHVGLYLVFIGAVLEVTRRRGRFLQTATAALGVETFLGCIALPLLFTGAAQSADGVPSALAALVLLLIVVWSIDIVGFILARALDRPYVVGVSIMLGYVVISMSLGELLFPTP